MKSERQLMDEIEGDLIRLEQFTDEAIRHDVQAAYDKLPSVPRSVIRKTINAMMDAYALPPETEYERSIMARMQVQRDRWDRIMREME